MKKEIMQRMGLSTKEEAIAKGISDLSDEEKLEYFSNLVPLEDDSLAMMYSIAERYNIEWMRKMIRMKLKLRTSVNGWRANQIVAVATEKMKQERKSLLARIFRRNEDKRRGYEEFE
jgi:hypothetical protein